MSHDFPHRHLLRAAGRIHDQLRVDRCHVPADLSPGYEVESLWQIVDRLRVAEARGWSLAVAELVREYLRISESLIARLQMRKNQLRDFLGDAPVASATDIWRDLAALHEEFDDVECDLKAATLAVVTGSIVLDGFNFGPFRIVLAWNTLRISPYTVVAVDPQPANSDTEVTHPHVKGKHLCEGDGEGPIHSALAQGRLFDFFILVRQILETYNPDSAYVNLSSWNGRLCSDCGDTVQENDLSSCERCERELCEGCAGSCSDCFQTCCSDCWAGCAKCGSLCCPACLRSCDVCLDDFCGSCRKRDDLCLSCHTLETPSDEPNPTPETPLSVPAEAESAVQSLCLGQAPVPA